MPLPPRLKNLMNRGLDCAFIMQYEVYPSAPQAVKNGIISLSFPVDGSTYRSQKITFSVDNPDSNHEPIYDTYSGRNTNGVAGNKSYSLNLDNGHVNKSYRQLGSATFPRASSTINQTTGTITIIFTPDVLLQNLPTKQVEIPLNVNFHNGNGVAVQPIVVVLYDKNDNGPDVDFDRNQDESDTLKWETDPIKKIQKKLGDLYREPLN